MILLNILHFLVLTLLIDPAFDFLNDALPVYLLTFYNYCYFFCYIVFSTFSTSDISAGAVAELLLSYSPTMPRFVVV